MAALHATGGGARPPRLLLSRRVDSGGIGGGIGGGVRAPRTPPPTLLASVPPMLLGGGGGAGGGGAVLGLPALHLTPHAAPSPALLLAAARVARHRAAAAAAAAAGAGAGARLHHPSNHHHYHHGPAPPRVASTPAPSAQALVGAGEVDDDGEPRPREEGDGVAAATTTAAAGTGAATAAAAAASSACAYSTSSSGSSAPPPTPDPHQQQLDAAAAAAAAAASAQARSATPSTQRRGDDGEQPDDADAGNEDDEGGEGSELHAVNTAIRANALIFLAKLAVALASSSAAMFAEAVHSLVDVANQTLLRIGILKARRAPTEAHPLGFSRDQFIWPLISAVGIFCCGAGVSLVHGVAGLFEPARELGDLTASYAVLAVSLALESHSLLVALRTLQARAKRHGLPLMQYLRTGADPAATAVMMEDGAAVAGLLIAGGCLALCQLTGSTVWDSGGSVAVALLLGGVAVTLIQRNRLFLIGRAMPAESERRVLRYLESDPVIRRVRNARSEELGVRTYRFYSELSFDGGEMARRCLDRVGRRRLFGALAAAAAARDAARMDAIMTAYSAAVVSATGAEVDRLERQISALVPGIKHVDLETDREAAAGPIVVVGGGPGEGDGAPAAAAALSSADDDGDVYGGARLVLLEASSSPQAGGGGGDGRAGSGGGGDEAAEARAWLDQQLAPDGSLDARRARPSLSAAAYRELEHRMAAAELEQQQQQQAGGGGGGDGAFVADALKSAEGEFKRG